MLTSFEVTTVTIMDSQEPACCGDTINTGPGTREDWGPKDPRTRGPEDPRTGDPRTQILEGCVAL